MNTPRRAIFWWTAAGKAQYLIAHSVHTRIGRWLSTVAVLRRLIVRAAISGLLLCRLSSLLLVLLLVLTLLMLAALLLLCLLSLGTARRGVLARLVIIRQPYLQHVLGINDSTTCWRRLIKRAVQCTMANNSHSRRTRI